MAFRFRRSIKLLPGIKLNVGMKGMSVSAGVRGLSLTAGSRGLHSNVGIPGTGMSFRSKIGSSSNRIVSADEGENIDRETSEISLIVSLQEDGTVIFKDSGGNEISRNLVRKLMEQKGDYLNEWLTSQCENYNNKLILLINTHTNTPPPDEKLEFVPREFGLEKPTPPELQKASFLDNLIGSRKASIEEHNNILMSQFDDQLKDWVNKQNIFNDEERERRIIIEEGRFKSIEDMNTFLSEKLASLEWPYETTANYQIEDDGKILFLDVDLPEIEVIQNKKASVASRGFKLNIKDVAEAEQRKNYMIHVHGIGFRLIGEVFVALPLATKVIVSAYSQRLDSGTGYINDEYLYSVRVDRKDWSQLNFNNLNSIDVVKCLERFDLRRNMTSKGVFIPIDPFGNS